jgi:hypothetical protein
MTDVIHLILTPEEAEAVERCTQRLYWADALLKSFGVTMSEQAQHDSKVLGSISGRVGFRRHEPIILTESKEEVAVE